MKYTHLGIVVRRDPAEIHDLVDLALLGSVCLKKMISTGVFVLVVWALQRPISVFAENPRLILVLRKHKRSRSTKISGPRSYFYKGRQRTNKARSQRKKMISWRYFDSYIIKLSVAVVKQKNRLEKLSLMCAPGFLFLKYWSELRYF